MERAIFGGFAEMLDRVSFSFVCFFAWFFYGLVEGMFKTNFVRYDCFSTSYSRGVVTP